jgi:eukaryotic-like serine/threonine-protein kinase
VTGGLRQVRIFVSSPTDAQFERSRLERVVERLNGEFAGVARIAPVRWETEFYKAHTTFQAQIPEAAQCDVVVAIFRARLGTELPADFQFMPNGEPYPSGTAYEVLSAIAAAKTSGHPDVYVFRFPEPPSVQLDDPRRADIEAQWTRLKAFFETWFRTPAGHFKAGFQTFSSTDDFETQAETLLRKWLDDNVLLGRSAVWPVDIKGSPFRGLAAFGAKHAPVFFGRSRDIAKAADRLKDAAEKGCSFLLVVGASGAGKSSLVRAGLVPRLTAAGVVTRVDVWRVAVMRPDETAGDPFAALAKALFVGGADLPEDELGRPLALPELATSDFPRPEDYSAQLMHADPTAIKPLISALTTVARAQEKSGGYEREFKATLLLVVDQLDELFGMAAEMQVRFARLIDLLARSGRVWIIATLRADLFDSFIAQPVLKQLKEDGASYDLAPPDAAELSEIVRGPAIAAGLLYEKDLATGESLDERLLKDAGRSDLLPLLQFTLNQLFEAGAEAEHRNILSFATYQALGGLEGAVDREAETALHTLDDAERARLPRLLRELAVPARDGAISASRASFDIRAVPYTVAAYDETSAKLARVLIDARILLSFGQGKQATLRLAHARVLDAWQRANKIVADNVDFYHIRADVEEQRRKWEAAKRSRDLLISRGRPLAEAESIVRRFPEEIAAATRDFIKRSARRARLAQTLTASAAVLFALVAGAAIYAERQAVRAQQEADMQRLRAEDTLAAATKTANSLVFDLARRFRDIVGMPANLVKDILDRARALQEQLIKSGQATPELRFSQAAALEATITALMAIGDTAGALAAADEARQITADLVASNPANTDWQRALSVLYNKMGDVLVAQGNLAGALQSYRDGLAIIDRLAKSNTANLTWQRDVSISFNKIGDVEVARGDLAGALQSYRNSLAIRERLAKSDPENAGAQRDLAISYDHIGNVQSAQGELARALESYRYSLAIRERLAKSDPSNAGWQRDLAISYDNVGDMQVARGDLVGALQSYREDLAISERLARADPGNAGWQRDFSVSLTKVGDVLEPQGDLAGALKCYRESLAIIERLAKSDFGNASWQRDLAISYDRIGKVQMAQGDLAGALKSYRDSLAIRERIPNSDHGSAVRQRDLAISYDNVGDVQMAQGDLAGALQSYHDSLAIRERLAQADPSNTGWQRDLAVSYNKIGEAKTAQGDLTAAFQSYQNGFAVIAALLAGHDANNAGWRRDLSISHEKIGDVQLVQGNLSGALQSYRDSLAIREQLAQSDPSNSAWQRDLAMNYAKLANVHLRSKAAGTALELFRQGQAIIARLAMLSPSNAKWKKDLAWFNEQIAALTN